MPKFANPFSGVTPGRKMTSRELTRAVRLALSSEEEAVHLYQTLADAAGDPLAKVLLNEIANEERVHKGEFRRLLNILLPDEEKWLAECNERGRPMDTERPRAGRDFLVAARTVGAGLLTGCSSSAAMAEEKKVKEGEEGVTATEDLMREHGLLERVLLIYEEGIRRFDAREALLPEPLSDAAMIVRALVEDHHGKQEESDVFPRLEKAGKLASLTAILRAQHNAGRGLTDGILKRLDPNRFNVPESRRELAALMRSFARMYRPHYAREDTVVFPAFREVVPPDEFAQLADQFEDREREVLGPEGFEKAVAHVARIEEAMEIADLDQFAPKT